MRIENDEHCPEIVFAGRPADILIERLRSVRDLAIGMDEIDPRFLTAKDLARYLTFFQVIAFGENGRHDDKFGSRFQRNFELLQVNPQIVGLSETVFSQTLVLEGFQETLEVDLGFFDGATIVYPLSSRATKLYVNNCLPPHAFMPGHVVPEDAEEVAAATFIGGAIHLPSIRDLMFAQEDGNRDGFRPFHEPPGICDAIGKRVVNFSPEVEFEIINKLPTLLPVRGSRLPLVLSAVSGRGHGEQTLMRLGFVLDQRPIDHASLDRRWVFDLNDLHQENLPINRRVHLLNSWRWFLKNWNSSSSLSLEIEHGLKEIAGQR